MIDPIRAAALEFARASAPQGPLTVGQGERAGGMSFGEVLHSALGEVSAVQDGAQEIMQAFLRGEPVELHEVMAATEEAGLALELLVELRNKLTEAYRTVITMQS